MSLAYQRVVDDLLRRIGDGEWREGERIPSLTDLEKAYPQSRMTVYKALQHLSERGHLRTTRGRGTFVKAARLRPRVAVLTGAQVFDQGVVPFAVQAFRHAQAYLARCAMDTQLYAEDSLSPTGLPSGLHEELDRHKLAGLLTVTAAFPWRYLARAEWQTWAIPHVNLGPGPALHSVDVDRPAFLRHALRLARDQGRRRVALLERHEHLGDHLASFDQGCAELDLHACPTPALAPSAALTYEEYGFQLLHRAWESSPRPDVVIVPDDVIAKGVAQAAAVLAIPVPTELTLIAMTNRGSRLFYPVPVVAVEVDVEAMVATATRTLIDLMNGVRVRPRTLLVPPVPASSPIPTVTRPSGGKTADETARRPGRRSKSNRP